MDHFNSRGVNKQDANPLMDVKNDVTNYLKDDCDVNEQDENGNTPLHRAISADASIDVLRNLLQKGASVTVTNKKYRTLLQCINRDSVQTALNLLKLEKEFDFKDARGRTCFHRLLGPGGHFTWQGAFEESNNEQKTPVGQFWEAIVNDMEQFGIDPNVQDKRGNTPLHFAAMCRCQLQHMFMLLSHFPNIDPLLVNCNGDTFLHEYFSWPLNHNDCPAFDTRLLQGEFNACPRPVLKQLLNCRNKKLKETPMHTFVQLVKRRSVTVDVFECFAAAGADFNIPNIIGDTVLHCLIHGRRVHEEVLDFRKTYFWKPEAEDIRNNCIKFIVKNGADISKKNNMGEPPLFMADRVKTISILLDNGAKVDERNKLDQTALLAYMCRPGANIDIINLLLERGADINARDKYGSSALHYAAWHDVGLDIVDSLMDNGATLQPDSLKQLPCHVAYWRGSEEIFNKVCMCKDDLHKGKEHFNFKTTSMEYSELNNTSLKVLERASQHLEIFRGRNIAHLLNMPGFGLVRFDGEAEAIDVKATVTACLRNICEEIAKEENWLSCTVIQSGSVSEMTKVGLPDEFDFVCVFDKISEVCDIDEQKSSTDPGFAYLKLKPEHSNTECSDIFNKDGYFRNDQFLPRFDTSIRAKLLDLNSLCNSNLSYIRTETKLYAPTFQYTLQWIGAFYKNLIIDIDMVPACQIKGFWPEKANLNALKCDVQILKDEGSLIILQNKEFPLTKIPLRISALKAEQRHMQSIPSIAKEAYVVSKILCNNRICPTLHNQKDVKVKDVIASYMLKMCMFHVHHKMSVSNKDKCLYDVSKSNVDRYNEELYKYVLQIYQTLLKFSENKGLPSFIFPWQNVFTFARSKDNVNREPERCGNRRIYAKMILYILGETSNLPML